MRAPEGRGLGRRGAVGLGAVLLLTGAFPADSGSGGLPSSPAEMASPDPLAELLAEAPGDTAAHEDVLALVKEAADALDGDQPREALALYDSVATLAPTLGDWVPVLKAEAAAEAGLPEDAARFMEEAPEGAGLRERWGWRFDVRALEAAGDTLEAALEAARAAARRSAGEDRATAYHRSASLFLDGADTARARQAASDALDSAPASGPARRAARLLHELSDLPEDRRVPLAEALLDHGEWEPAWELLEERLADDPGGNDEERLPGPRVGADMGRGLVHMGEYRDALRLLEPLDSPDTPSEVRAYALYWTGRALLADGREDEGLGTLRRVTELAPDHRAAGRAHLRLAEEAAEEDDRSSAARHLEALAVSGHRSSSSDLLVTRLASRSYLDGAYQEAAALLEGYANDVEGGLADKVRHWRGLVMEAQGREEEAREILRQMYDRNPFSFHGVAAAHHLDLPLLESDVPLGPSDGEDLERETANAVLRLHVHRYVPTPGSFAHELERLEDHFLAQGGDAAYQLAEALIDGGLTTQGILLGRRLHREAGEWDLRLLRIVFPFPYRGDVVRMAHQRDLDPFLVAGLIRQESMFRPDIRSPAGAVGLMQLMPPTARGVAQQEGLGGSLPISRLEDPQLNLRLGTRFLRQMLDRFDGSVTDALAAYNAGPTNASRWRRFEEYADVDVFVAHIPFRETRHYVRIVQQNARIYAALYGCGDFQACPGLSYAQWVERTQPLVRPPASIPAR